MVSQIAGALAMVAGLVGYYVDFLLVRFLFRFGHGVAKWLGGPEVIGTGIGLLLIVLFLGVIVGIFAFSSVGIYAGFGMISRHSSGFPWGGRR